MFNPLDKQNLGKSLLSALLESEAVGLQAVSEFLGAGVYAIYYSGQFANYKILSDLNKEHASYPIYVGKAAPKGARKGLFSDASPESNALFRRIQEHCQSIQQASNLEAGDFSCRWLVIDDIWIPLAETLLIQKFEPLWNQVVEGFGNHNPGSGRHKGRMSAWDALHPGRPWARQCKHWKKEQVNTLLKAVDEYMSRLNDKLASSPNSASPPPAVWFDLSYA